MATYDEIYGKRVDVLSTDPTLVSTDAGKVWYNSTSGTLKTVVESSAWSSASPINTARGALGGTGATQNATLIAGGLTTPSSGPPQTVYANTEEYNGSGWSNGGSLNTARRDIALFGTQTSAVGAGGSAPPGYTNASESYNGTAWTAKPNINTTRSLMGGAGASNTSGIIFGGWLNPGTSAATEEWDGSSWTTVNAMNTARHNPGGVGTETAALAFAGSDPAQSKHTEEYNGTNWTTVNNMPTATGELGSAGIQTSALGAGGYTTTYSNLSFTYDGTNWSNAPNLAAARTGGGAGGANSGSAVIAGGYPAGGSPSITWLGTSEEFNRTINTITPATFSSGNNQNLASYNRSGWGTQNAAWVAGGSYPSNKNESEEYDGTTWTEGNNLNTATNAAAVGGPQTAAIFATGNRTTNVEYYDGTSWTAQPASPQARSAAAGGGTQTSFVVAGGTTAGAPTYPMSSTGEEWNGSSWTSAGALPAPQGSMNGSALGESESAVILAGGAKSPAGPPGVVPHTVTNISLDYGGTSWTANPTINTARVAPYFFGTTSLGILAGGDTNNSGATTTISEQWNGSVFVTGANMATGRYTGGRAGTATAGLVAGGYPGSPSPAVGNATELYTGETTAVNAKTLTTS